MEGSRLGPLAERLAELGELDAAVGLARPSPWHAFEVFTAIAARLPLDEVRKALSEHRWEARLWKPDARLAARLAQLGQVDEALSILAGLPPGEARYQASALVGRHLQDGPDRQAAVMDDLEQHRRRLGALVGLERERTAARPAARRATPQRLPANS